MADTLQIVLPPAADQDELAGWEAMLVDLTKRLCHLGLADEPGGGLGGSWDYGTNFENKTFFIHRFCWCEQADCPWCQACDCEHTGDCEVCRGEKFPEFGGQRWPNFYHKSTNSAIWWYKWIGRDTRVCSDAPVYEVWKSCVDSIKEEKR